MVIQPPEPSEGAGALRQAILCTIVYGDLFDYPLDVLEIHRYLSHVAAPLEAVAEMLDSDPVLRELIDSTGPWYHLVGRAHLSEVRAERALTSRALWDAAQRFGAVIARLPFVRLAAVSGALAVNNAPPGDDIDLFLLVAPRRLWLCRLLVLVVVRYAALRGVELCPNYLLSTDRLPLHERNHFTAHEVAQLVPLDGSPWYHAFLEANQWVRAFLPNALDPRDPLQSQLAQSRRKSKPSLARLGEAVLGMSFFDRLERWEMDRKIRRLTARAAHEGGSVSFSADECQGHFAAHDQRVLSVFEERFAPYQDLLDGRAERTA